jgi:hypothetical protein
MRSIFRVLAIFALVAAVFVLVTDSRARDKQSKLTKGSGPQALTVSGEYTGSFDDVIALNGTKVQTNRKTTVYFVGEGLKPKSTFVTNRWIQMRVKVKDGVPVATMVLVRPGDASMVSMTLDMDNSTPSTAKYRMPSTVDPNVGELMENAPR